MSNETKTTTIIQKTQPRTKLKITKLIGVSFENYEALKNLGRAGDSFNDVVTMLLKEKGFI